MEIKKPVIEFPVDIVGGNPPDVQGWEIPLADLEKAIASLGPDEDTVWFAVRNKVTGDYISPDEFSLFIRKGQKGLVWCWYGGGEPGITDDDGWFNDFPPIPPGS
jgi:hypothetical protein